MTPVLQPQSADVLGAYEAYVRDGKLKEDPAQQAVMIRLQELERTLSATRKRSFLGFLQPKAKPAPSLYLYGPIGRGKSLLMDIFYHSVPINHKRRIHFHAFMQEVHAMAHAWRMEIETKHLKKDLLAAIAHDIAVQTQLLCLDELQVTDVADAMILSKLFTEMLDQGMSIVITSNRPPEELYQGGLQREQFLHFIALVRSRMEVLELTSPQDYRLQQIKALKTVYMSPISPEADASFDALFAELTHHAPLPPVMLEVQGHALSVPESYGGVACFAFADLCAKPLGAADYLAIAARYHTVFLRAVPAMGSAERNEAKRFVTLIDTLYDHRVKLICTAAVPPDGLYPAGDGTFEFARTVSRLAEMQSAQYLASPHIP